MEPIRPIGPRELDVEPVAHVPRSSRDGAGGPGPDPREPGGRREPRRPQGEPETIPQPPPDGGSLIDIRV